MRDRQTERQRETGDERRGAQADKPAQAPAASCSQKPASPPYPPSAHQQRPPPTHPGGCLLFPHPLHKAPHLTHKNPPSLSPHLPPLPPASTTQTHPLTPPHTHTHHCCSNKPVLFLNFFTCELPFVFIPFKNAQILIYPAACRVPGTFWWEIFTGKNEIKWKICCGLKYEKQEKVKLISK